MARIRIDIESTFILVNPLLLNTISLALKAVRKPNSSFLFVVSNGLYLCQIFVECEDVMAWVWCTRVQMAEKRLLNHASASRHTTAQQKPQRQNYLVPHLPSTGVNQQVNVGCRNTEGQSSSTELALSHAAANRR
jgi:hypothetical protein